MIKTIDALKSIKKMRRIIFIICFVLGFYGKSFSCEQDSTFHVSLEQDTLYKGVVRLSFENMTNDSIVLISRFENCLQSPYHSPGIKMWFYMNDKVITPSWGEMRPQEFVFGDTKVSFSPKEKKIFNIEIPYISGIYKDDGENKYKVDFEIFYRYVNMTKRKANSKQVITNKLELN